AHDLARERARLHHAPRNLRIARGPARQAARRVPTFVVERHDLREARAPDVHDSLDAMTATRAGAARAVLVPYVLSRVLVIGALLTTRHIFTTLKLAQPLAAHQGLDAWDASWYRDIASDGYDLVQKREGLRFFPVFPFAARVVSWFPG